ncbi:nucleobase:cation symporter-2 family protein [Solirhodobacter olei]|uniref:nucleobase:cation symporter-2 family protein n=1 Tax=Solirhodobacter olei TaxID=2493082 RepID=UPI000FDC63F5|nr:nucleobase:cation symporter-2 family protein [Solirhodobacter olei]
MTQSTHPVDEVLPAGKLLTLGLQHVLVMYAGAIAVPYIIGGVLNLPRADVAYLISADLFACGIVSIIQSFGIGGWVGVRLPVMMGVTFASVGPMIAIGVHHSGTEGARIIFGSIMAAGVVGILIAPAVSKLLRFFPAVVTGTVITVIGITLMEIGIWWIFGNPAVMPPKLVDPAQAHWLKQIGDLAAAQGSAVPAVPHGLKLVPTQANPAYANGTNLLISALVLIVVLGFARYAKGFLANIAVLMGIVAGGVVAAIAGLMGFGALSGAAWFAPIVPFHFGTPIFQVVPILTMVLVILITMVESTGMFLALCDMTDSEMTQPRLAAGLRGDGLGTLVGGLFNTFPYTSFSQNVGLVGVTGIRSRFVTVTGGAIMLVLGLVPKIGALVAALPTAVLGGAGLVMFGMVAATGIRILGRVDFHNNRHNLFIVAISIGMGMIPMVAPNFDQWMPQALHPMLESGILLATVSAVVLNAFLNGAHGTLTDARDAAEAAEA